MIFSGRNQGYNCGSAFHHQFDHFWALNDVTVAVRNRTSQIFLELFIDWSAIGNRDQRKENWRGSRLLISSFDFRRSLHSGFDHIKAENDVTVAVRSRFSIFFVQKIVTLMLEISLAKYEVILTNRSRVSFSCSTTANFHFPPSGAIWAKNETVISHDPADQHGRFLAFITSNEHNKRKNMVFVQLLWCFY